MPSSGLQPDAEPADHCHDFGCESLFCLRDFIHWIVTTSQLCYMLTATCQRNPSKVTVRCQSTLMRGHMASTTSATKPPWRSLKTTRTGWNVPWPFKHHWHRNSSEYSTFLVWSTAYCGLAMLLRGAPRMRMLQMNRLLLRMKRLSWHYPLMIRKWLLNLLTGQSSHFLLGLLFSLCCCKPQTLFVIILLYYHKLCHIYISNFMLAWTGGDYLEVSLMSWDQAWAFIVCS